MVEKDEPSLELPSFRLTRRRAAPRPEAPTLVEDAREPVVGEVVQRPARALRLRLPGPLAAAVTGLVVGAVAVGLVWASQGACEAWRGTSSCGGGPGLLLLVLDLVVLTLLGTALLRLLDVDHAGSTSSLAVGLAAVATLLLFVDVLFERAGAVVVVLAGIAAYVTARAVTAAAAE